MSAMLVWRVMMYRSVVEFEDLMMNQVYRLSF